MKTRAWVTSATGFGAVVAILLGSAPASATPEVENGTGTSRTESLCAATVTAVDLSGPEEVHFSGATSEAWIGSNWALRNNGKSRTLGQAAFEIEVPAGAQAGDTFSLRASNLGVFIGSPTDLYDSATEELLARSSSISDQEILFVLTDAARKPDVRANFSITYGVSGTKAPGGELTPETTYEPTFSGCGEGASASLQVVTSATPPYNPTGLRTGWGADQDHGRFNVVYNGTSAVSDQDIHTVTLEIDRPGSQFECSQLQNSTSPFGVGYAIWSGKLITEAPLSSPGSHPLQPNQYEVVTCEPREIHIAWRPGAIGQTFRTQLLTIPDGTTEWQQLGETPFQVTVREVSPAGVNEVSGKPKRPVSGGGGEGGITFVDPVISKTWEAEDSQFVLTVANTSHTGVVRENTYTDALYSAIEQPDGEQLAISRETMGTVDANEWTLPRLAPGESATAYVDFDAESLGPGETATNRLGITGSECVGGILADSEVGPLCAESSVSGFSETDVTVGWNKVDPQGEKLAGSEWVLTDEEGNVRRIVDNGAHDLNPAPGMLSVSVGEGKSFTLREAVAPQGFVLKADEVKFPVGSGRSEIGLGDIVNWPEIATVPPQSSREHEENTDARGDENPAPAERLARTGGTSYFCLLGAGALLASGAFLLLRRRNVQRRNSAVRIPAAT